MHSNPSLRKLLYSKRSEGISVGGLLKDKTFSDMIKSGLDEIMKSYMKRYF